LDEAFAALDRARANVERNIQNAEELFHSKLEGVFSGNNNSEGSHKSLKDVCFYDKETNDKTGLPYVGLADIESDTGKFLGELKPKEMKSRTFYFNQSHLLYGRLRPYLNKILLPNFEGHCSTEISPIETINKIIKAYLFYWFLKPSTVKKINKTTTGTRMPRANMDEVLNFDIIVPCIEEQKQIVSLLIEFKENTELQIQNYKRQLSLLEELKKSILQEAFSRQLTGAESAGLEDAQDKADNKAAEPEEEYET